MMTADDLREIAAHHAQQEADIAEYARREGLTPEQVRDSRWDPECVRDHADRGALLALVRRVAKAGSGCNTPGFQICHYCDEYPRHAIDCPAPALEGLIAQGAK